MNAHLSSFRTALVAALGPCVVAVLAGCATPGAPASASSAAASPAASSAPLAEATLASNGADAKPAPPAAGARPAEAPLRAFADVVKGASEIKGYFPLWRKDEKVWIEIAPGQLDRPFLFSTVLSRGLAQMPFVSGLMGNSEMARFHRVGNQIQLIAQNTLFRTAAGSPLAQAARDNVSDSILASGVVASALHAERKTFLVDANALLLSDIAGLGTVIDTAFRVGYALDKANSSIERVHGSADETLIAVSLHYAVAKLPAPPATPSPTPAPPPTPPRAVPDQRSFLLGVQYRFVALPEPPMPMRLADERVGYFTEDFRDLTRGYRADPRAHVIDRWRLEKKDPGAALSDPVHPIVAVLDRNIPLDLRQTVTEGVLEWNKAFEQAGFSHAIVVQQQPDDADWDSLEGRHIAVKWFVDSSTLGTTAIGPHLSDPRTGEILYAAALIPDAWARISGQRFDEVLPPRAQTAASRDAHACSYGFDALEQAGFTYAVLAERGGFADGKAAEDYIRNSIRAVVTHEVGHALGLRHNFLASHAMTAAQLRDPAFTNANGLSASIMDYVPENLPLDSDKTVARLQMDAIGVYDRWAIEWGYRQFDPAKEAVELERLADRATTDPRLAYATDEDAGSDGDQLSAASGIDPRVNRFDLGDDALAYYERQIRLTRELWTRTEHRRLSVEDDFQMYRRNLERGMRQMRGVTPNLAKFIGGLYVNRVRAGASTALLVPVEPQKSRAALRMLTTELFAPSSFRFEPAFMQRLGIDRFARDRESPRSPDFSLPAAVLNVQKPVLDQLMSDLMAQRLADAEPKAANPRDLLSFADVQAQLTAAVWQEVGTGQEIGSLRRNLQREHLRRLAGALLKPAASPSADTRSVFRFEAERLAGRLRAALATKGAPGDMTRAHLAESLQTLREALSAQLNKTGV